MEGQGLTTAFGVVDAAESSRQVTSDDSNRLGVLVGALQCVTSLSEMGGGVSLDEAPQYACPPRALAENIKGPKSQEIQQAPSLLSPITFMIFS